MKSHCLWTAFRAVVTEAPAAYPNSWQFFASVWHHVPWGCRESQSLGSLGVSGVSGVLGVSESQNHELYYSQDSFVNSFQQLSLLVQPRLAFKTISSETVNASCWMIQKVGDTKKYNVFKYLKPRMLFILHKSVSTLQPDIIIYILLCLVNSLFNRTKVSLGSVLWVPVSLFKYIPPRAFWNFVDEDTNSIRLMVLI